MREWVFELAVAKVAESPPDSIVNRLVRSFALLSDCPMAILVVPRDNRQEIISSYGIPSTFVKRFIDDAPKDPSLYNSFRIIENLKEDPLFAFSTSVHEALDVNFITISPIGFPFFNFGVHLITADFRVGVQRRSDLIVLMERMSEILASALVQQGEIAVLERQIDSIRFMARRFSEIALNSSQDVAILDMNGEILNASSSFKERFLSNSELSNFNIDSLFSESNSNISKALLRMKEDSEPLSVLRVRPPGQTHEEMLTILSVAPDGPRSANYVCHVRPLFFTKPDDQFNSELIAGAGERVAEEEVTPAAEPASVTVRFLANTLIKQPRLSSRSGTSYHSLRRWRLPIKDYQLEALKALKSDSPPEFVNLIAAELIEAANLLFGEGSFDAVVPVPCGNSGPDCLARKLSFAVAELARIPQIDSFKPLPTSGASHPKKNMRRAKMELVAKLTGHILLVDDVATSGSHIVEATNLLRSGGATVFPLAWIAS